MAKYDTAKISYSFTKKDGVGQVEVTILFEQGDNENEVLDDVIALCKAKVQQISDLTSEE